MPARGDVPDGGRKRSRARLPDFDDLRGGAALRQQSDLAAEWEPRIKSNEYDSRFMPAADKTAVLIGMAMTEKQGGSDVPREHDPRRAGGSRRAGGGVSRDRP